MPRQPQVGLGLLLRKKGFKARRLEAGMPEWRHAGLPVERSYNGIA